MFVGVCGVAHTRPSASDFARAPPPPPPPTAAAASARPAMGNRHANATSPAPTAAPKQHVFYVMKLKDGYYWEERLAVVQGNLLWTDRPGSASHWRYYFIGPQSLVAIGRVPHGTIYHAHCLCTGCACILAVPSQHVAEWNEAFSWIYTSPKPAAEPAATREPAEQDASQHEEPRMGSTAAMAGSSPSLPSAGDARPAAEATGGEAAKAVAASEENKGAITEAMIAAAAHAPEDSA